MNNNDNRTRWSIEISGLLAFHHKQRVWPGAYAEQESSCPAATPTAPQPAASLRPGWYICYSERIERFGVTLTWYWDADQCSFERLEPWATCYPTRFDAENEYAARDFGSWMPRAQIVQVERVY